MKFIDCCTESEEQKGYGGSSSEWAQGHPSKGVDDCLLQLSSKHHSRSSPIYD